MFLKRARLLIFITTATFVLSFAASLTLKQNVSALSGSEFQAGRIIDESVFYNGGSMTTQQIQDFLNSKVPSCDTNGSKIYSGSTTRAQYGASVGNPAPYTCLRNYSQTTTSKPLEPNLCNGHTSGVKSAAQIIYEVSVSCNVSPKVLIVLLQKEQSLITDDWPWSIQYRSATGYGCPDTAPCDAQYYGFFNQVYSAARQYKYYAANPDVFGYKAGRNNFILYNPNQACGGSNVYIQNQATAGLYIYTPYQPNASALANLYGSGDSCGAYGNRNFWRLFNDWFGSTQTNSPFLWSYQGSWAYSDSARTSAFTSIPTVAPNAKIYVRVKARNMGNQIWTPAVVRMGSSRPNDRTSLFRDASWPHDTRPTSLLEPSVAPGSVGTFEFILDAPSAPGSYKEYFNAVAEGVTWFNDIGLYYPINVVSPVSAYNSINTGLSPGSVVKKNEFLLSPDAQSVLTVQPDGNVVLYRNFKAVWSSNTRGQKSDRLVMQSDGNLVLYNTNNQAVWNSATNGNAGSRLTIQTDGNVVIYSASNSPVWATSTLHTPNLLKYVNTTLPTSRLYPGQILETANRRYKMVLQRDGNLVLYSPNRAIWSSGTQGKSVLYLALQSDGNLVLYDKSAKPVWHSSTIGQVGSQLHMQSDGNLVLYNSANKPTWNTQTQGAL